MIPNIQGLQTLQKNGVYINIIFMSHVIKGQFICGKIHSLEHMYIL